MTVDWVRRYQESTHGVWDFIDGRRQPVTEGRVVEKYCPRDGKLLCSFGSGHPAQIDHAVHGAQAAFDDGRWSKQPAQQRKQVLLNLAVLMERHAEELGLLEAIDVGKPISDAINTDVPLAVSSLRFSAEAVDKFYGKVYASDVSSLSYELRRPLGVVAGIVGWNFPLYLATQKIGPVLATGNSLVLKPSELTASSAARLAELAVEAGLPPGVFNVVNGDATVGNALALHPGVSLLTFTGSSRTGKSLLIAAGQSNMKRLILECGGKSPTIVFEDCPDVSAIADRISNAAFWNLGQVCVASSRLLVQEGVKGEMIESIIKKVAALKLGDPLDPETKLGALVSAGQRAKVLEYIDIGQREGAKVIHQGDATPPVAGGFYIPPTIFDHVEPAHKIAREEIFGPVLSIMAFRDEAEAVKIANGTPYGLSAVLWTKNIGRAHRMSQQINAGWIVVNGTDAPTGGPAEGVLSIGGHKQSGIGLEGGTAGLEAYTSNTAVQWFV